MSNMSANILILVLLVMIVLLLACSGLRRDRIDCSSVHNGRFWYNSWRDGHAISVIRGDSIQIEKDSAGQFGFSLGIRWIDDCRFLLTPISVHTAEVDSTYESTEMTVEILTVGQGYHVTRSTDSKADPPYESVDTLWSSPRQDRTVQTVAAAHSGD